MSEPKHISPLLDGFSVGPALGSHDGVACCPALKDDSEKKYIVKIISVPASQVQLDALLLTGAYKDPTSALEYFKELSEGVEREAACLKNLSRLEGFLPYEAWQTVPMDGGRLGYEVYLLSTYKQSLEKYMRRHSITHLSAVNLGIDICGALSAARRAGWIYVDLKPSNIFISENKEFRIGDLGLMELDGLDLASLPSKYRSAYTAPELADEVLSPNTTMDTYALGMILYQLFNNGVLPQVAHPTEEAFPPPENADYEMAQIILKAISPDPADRWEDPVQMGQSLVAYMQRNTVNDIPVVPPTADIVPEQTMPTLEFPGKDETLPGMNDELLPAPEELSEEMTEMIALADELIEHETPAPAVAPEAASVEELEAQVVNAAQEEAPPPRTVTPVPAAAATAVSTGDSDHFNDLSDKRKKARRKGWILPIVIVLILALIGGGGWWYYQNCYLLMVDGLSVDGAEDQMTVVLDTDIDNSLLTVVCTDTYGNTKQSPVTDGRASFEELLPDMLYKIRVEVEGFHQLDGSTTHEYMTPAQTKIVSYTAATGPEDGSVILNFAVDGPDSDSWSVTCSAADEIPVTHTFTGHMYTVTGLTVGKTYSFRLSPADELYITGDDTLEFTAASIIIAEDIHITTDASGNLTVTWSAPEGAEVESWDVHCYSNDGYDQRLTTDSCTATFSEIGTGSAYTVEIVAAGMSQPARAGITANPIFIDSVNVDDSDPTCLTVSWEFTGNAPEGGWLLLYTIDGSERQQIVQCETNTGVVEVRVPAADYEFTIQAADASTVFHNTASFSTPNADIYENAPQAFHRKHQSAYFFVNLLRTPETANWNHSHVYQNMYTSTFAPGEKISVLLYYMKDFYIRHENISVMYVIRDAEGTVLADYIGMENLDWRDDMWCGPNYHYCGLDVPLVPTEPGTYTLGVYFNGYAITSVEFTITE